MATLDPGYYLTTYLAPPELSNLLGIRPRHDQNLTLWHLGRQGHLDLVRHWELERLSGEKHHWQVFPDVSAARARIATLLAHDGVVWDDLRAVWGTPGLDAGPACGSPDPRFPLHTIAHLFPTLIRSTEELASTDILSLAVDGGPDHMLGRTTFQYVGAVARRGSIRYFPVESPGRLFNSATHLFGLQPGSLMALATATDTVVEVDLAALLATARFDRSVPGTKDDVVAVADEILRTIHTAVIYELHAVQDDEEFTAAERVTSATMKVVQALSIRIMERNVDRALDEFGLDPTATTLGMSGGFALNCPTNSALLDRYGFQDFSAPPCPNDSGQAIGVGLAVFHSQLGATLRYQFPGPYLGGGADDLDEALERFTGHVLSVEHGFSRFVDDIVAGPVAWVDGRSEIGPRALGHRSLLCDPRSIKARERMNEIKRRQWWRPVAPIVALDRMSEWFEGACSSPYMLRTFQAKAGRRGRIPAVVHLDGSARCQTVEPHSVPRMYELVTRFDAACGIPILGNSSLNDRCEPIVQSALDALGFCVRRGVRVCYLNGRRITLAEEGPSLDRDRRARSWLWEKSGQPLAARVANPHQLPDEDLYFLATHPALQAAVDIGSPEGAARVGWEAGRHYTTHPGDLRWVQTFLARKQVEIQ